MKLFLIFFISSLISSSVFCQQEIPTKAQLTENVGDIGYDPATDRPMDFLHGDNHIFWYYSVNTSYVGGKKAIAETTAQNFKYRRQFRNVNGFITIKFVINTLGETDRFRVSQIDEQYKQTKFNGGLVTQLMTIVKALNRWIPGKYHNGTLCNSYYYLNFKIVNGRIAELTP